MQLRDVVDRIEKAEPGCTEGMDRCQEWTVGSSTLTKCAIIGICPLRLRGEAEIGSSVY
jgi:hypothetical protein